MRHYILLLAVAYPMRIGGRGGHGMLSVELFRRNLSFLAPAEQSAYSWPQSALWRGYRRLSCLLHMLPRCCSDMSLLPVLFPQTRSWFHEPLVGRPESSLPTTGDVSVHGGAGQGTAADHGQLRL